MAALVETLCGNLPHFPDPHDPDQRVRMGCPLDGEDLLHRYASVVSGTSPKGWADDTFLFGYHFEWSLADLAACSLCQASNRIQHHRLNAAGDEMPDGSPTWAEWVDCRSVRGRGYYMALNRKQTQETGRPCFVMTLCHTPLTRKGEIAGRMGDYR